MKPDFLYHLVGSRVRHNTPEEGRRAYQPKRCVYNNEDEDNRLNILSDKKVSRHF